MSDWDNTTAKECKACGTVKEFTQFHPSRSRLDGRMTECIPCLHERTKQIVKKPQNKEKRGPRDYYLASKESYKARAKKWAEANPEKRREITKAYTKRNPELLYEVRKKHRLANPGLYAAHYKMRQTRKRKAMPAWADQEAIRKIYDDCAEISRATGVQHHVDHYYPLKSDIVCGLHNEYNLRVIPAVENLSKGNSFPL